MHWVFTFTFGCSFKAGIRFISMKWEEGSNYLCQWVAPKFKMGGCAPWTKYHGEISQGKNDGGCAGVCVCVKKSGQLAL